MVRRLSRRNYSSKKVKSRGSRSLRKRGRSMRKRKRRATKSLKVGGSIPGQTGNSGNSENSENSEGKKKENGIWDDIPKEKIQTKFLEPGDFFITPNYTTTNGQYTESNDNNYILHVKYKGKLKKYKIEKLTAFSYAVKFGTSWSGSGYGPLSINVSNIGDAIKVLKEMEMFDGTDFSKKYMNPLSFEDYKKKRSSFQHPEVVFF